MGKAYKSDYEVEDEFNGIYKPTYPTSDDWKNAIHDGREFVKNNYGSNYHSSNYTYDASGRTSPKYAQEYNFSKRLAVLVLDLHEEVDFLHYKGNDDSYGIYKIAGAGFIFRIHNVGGNNPKITSIFTDNGISICEHYDEHMTPGPWISVLEEFLEILESAKIIVDARRQEKRQARKHKEEAEHLDKINSWKNKWSK